MLSSKVKYGGKSIFYFKNNYIDFSPIRVMKIFPVFIWSKPKPPLQGALIPNILSKLIKRAQKQCDLPMMMISW